LNVQSAAGGSNQRKNEELRKQNPEFRREEKYNNEISMINDSKSDKEHLSEIQKGGTQFDRMGTC